MKNYLKELIICGLVLFIILLHTCDNLKPECQENYIHDTITVEKWDTVHTPPIKIYLKPKNLVPIASYTLNEGEMPKDTNLALKRIYSDSIKDTNLVFYYNIETMGYLSKFEPSYKLFVPQRIEHTINNTITLQPKSRVGIYGGLVIGGNINSLNLAPFVVLTDKKDRLYGINYSLTNKSVNLSFGFPIKFHGTVSIDRINSDKGYTVDNIQLVHKDLNTMKMDFEQDYFIEMCKLVVKTHGYQK